MLDSNGVKICFFSYTSFNNSLRAITTAIVKHKARPYAWTSIALTAKWEYNKMPTDNSGQQWRRFYRKCKALTGEKVLPQRLRHAKSLLCLTFIYSRCGEKVKCAKGGARKHKNAGTKTLDFHIFRKLLDKREEKRE